jgi:phospholipase/carboxylesterase
MQALSTQLCEVDGWTVRYHSPEGAGPHPVLLLLHGWTGDENSMWVFANQMPPRYWLIAPRGIFDTPLGGRGWHTALDHSWPTLKDFRPAAESLLGLLSAENFPGADFSSLRLMGFSQGAALSYSLALTHPDIVERVAGLSGFFPEQGESLVERRVLAGKAVFVTHGLRDEIVPIDRARQSVAQLEKAGAQVT